MNPTYRTILRHERTLVLSLTGVLIVLAWLQMIQMAGGMAAMDHMAMMDVRLWPTFLMWAVMMMAMMLPSTAPAILMTDAAWRRHTGGSGWFPYLFIGGYLLAWIGFSAVAASGQWALHALLLLSPAMALNDAWLASGLLIAAGLYQWSPMKQACLRYCRSPLGLVAGGLPVNRAAVLGFGLKHGLYCVGCCWALMLLMFVGGVMSLVWMVLLTVVVVAEKVLPGGERTVNAGGAILIGLGVWLLLS